MFSLPMGISLLAAGLVPIYESGPPHRTYLHAALPVCGAVLCNHLRRAVVRHNGSIIGQPFSQSPVFR